MLYIATFVVVQPQPLPSDESCLLWALTFGSTGCLPVFLHARGGHCVCQTGLLCLFIYYWVVACQDRVCPFAAEEILLDCLVCACDVCFSAVASPPRDVRLFVVVVVCFLIFFNSCNSRMHVIRAVSVTTVNENYVNRKLSVWFTVTPYLFHAQELVI